MSEHDDETPDDDPNESSVIKELRAKVKAQEKQISELAEKATSGEVATRRMAFIEAGVDLADPKTGYFVKGYDGDFTTDAIKTAAVEAGFLQAEEPETQSDDSAPLGRILDASANGRTPKAASLDDQIAEAERNGDFTTSRLLKNQKVGAAMR